jgi:hypothetical protein
VSGGVRPTYGGKQMPKGIKGSTPQAKCHPDKKAKGLGLCESCYQRMKYETKPGWKEHVNNQNKKRYKRKMKDPEFRAKEKIREAKRRKKFKRIFAKRVADSRKKNPKPFRDKSVRSKARIKKEVLTHYGKCGKLQCCWYFCKIVDIDILTLDHIHNDGNKHILNLFQKDSKLCAQITS